MLQDASFIVPDYQCYRLLGCTSLQALGTSSIYTHVAYHTIGNPDPSTQQLADKADLGFRQRSIFIIITIAKVAAD